MESILYQMFKSQNISSSSYFVLVSLAGRWYFWNELDQIKVGWVGGS